jgi:hypothetical protein
MLYVFAVVLNGFIPPLQPPSVNIELRIWNLSSSLSLLLSTLSLEGRGFAYNIRQGVRGRDSTFLYMLLSLRRLMPFLAASFALHYFRQTV